MEIKRVTSILSLLLAGAAVCAAQSRPRTACAFAYDGFATEPAEKVQIGEVAPPSAVTLEACGSPKGCILLRARRGTPVQIYRTEGDWTCGYFSSREGAGPAWIRTSDLRILSYDTQPPLSAWDGIWAGGEDRVRIRAGVSRGTLHLTGNARWHGANDNVHLGDIGGDAAPHGNRLHFVDGNAGSCTIDLTLLGRYILANDNDMCGGMNVHFWGIWRRVGAARPQH